MGIFVFRIDLQRLSVMFTRLSELTPLEQSIAQVVVGRRISWIDLQRLAEMFTRHSELTPLEQSLAQVIVGKL